MTISYGDNVTNSVNEEKEQPTFIFINLDLVYLYIR